MKSLPCTQHVSGSAINHPNPWPGLGLAGADDEDMSGWPGSGTGASAVICSCFLGRREDFPIYTR